MPAADVIKRRAKSYTMTRPGTSAIVDGIATPSADTDIDIEAVIQPMTAKELRNLPPGQNAGEWVNVWSETQMKLNDVITYNGVAFTVQRTTMWEDGPFYIANANHTFDTLS